MKLYELFSHVKMVFLLVMIIIILYGPLGISKKDLLNLDVERKYGSRMRIIVYAMNFSIIFSLPMAIFCFLGFVFYNLFPKYPALNGSLTHHSLICFRVVTKGLNPTLIKTNVERNIKVCTSLGLRNFLFEIVSDICTNVPKNLLVKETVVPQQYQTSKCTLFKARALQYCLEHNVNVLNDEDWIVHLDEETILTKGSVIGIVNFIAKGTSSFGQGAITYANEDVVSWIATIFDLSRVAYDYGCLRFCLRYFRKPLLGLKGSYLVSNAGAERKVTFDFGFEGSLAEDCFFGLTAWGQGYLFDFIEGEMWEKSPFSLKDYVKQRKRWCQGILLTILSKQIPFFKKPVIICNFTAWVVMPFTACSSILLFAFPFPMPAIFELVSAFIRGVMIFVVIVGAIKSFKRSGMFTIIVICLLWIFLFPLYVLLETCAIIYAFANLWKQEFYTVQKEIHI